MKQKIQTLLNQLNHGLVEREATLKTALLTVLAGEHLVLIGPPGTGKSLIAQRIVEGLAYSRVNDYFEYLLTKFSTPEEIFGPLSITELKADRFKRNTACYLPKVKIAFLDEIFKASSSILNALLTILNERVYHNGSLKEDVPLQALIAASNELPTEQAELSALYDRFLVRSFVDYVSHDKRPLLFEKTGTMPALTKLTADDLDSIQRTAESVTIPPEIVQAIQRIWGQHKDAFKEDRRESLSDRRLKKVIKLLCVSAATNGRSQVDLSDVFLLKDCLWNHQDNAIKVRDLILSTLRSFSRQVPQDDSTTKAPANPTKASSGSGGVKGFRGSGTAHDPLLIQTVEDLMDLSRPDVGLKGYYFRQTANIDCSALSSWTDISFNGHYDGGGHTIGHNELKNQMGMHSWLCGRASYSLNLFANIQAESSIIDLKLDYLRLAATAKDSHIDRCLSTVELIERSAIGCTISACQAGSSLIRDAAYNCTITGCQSDFFLVFGVANNCIITDCLVAINLEWCTGSNNSNLGGIAGMLSKGSVVERCFVAGKLRNQSNGDFYFSGIATCCDGSTIRQCASGKFELGGSCVGLRGRIVEDVRNGSILENNASIDSNRGNDDISGPAGKTVAAALFKQRYFENALDWDFDTVWQWDDVNDRPALRSVGLGAISQQAKPAAQEANMTDLLTQQMCSNIWS
jgi:MoxR-like ATPase